MLLVAVAVALPYPQDAASPADPTPVVPGADVMADIGPHTTKDTVDTTRDIETTTTVNNKTLMIICCLRFTD
jgi:hypothetical protein